MLNHVHAVHGNEHEELDQEWLELLSEAKKLGLTFTEIKSFFQAAPYAVFSE